MSRNIGLKRVLGRFLILFIVLFHFEASSQDWEEAFLMSEKSIESGDFPSARKHLIDNKSQFEGDSLKAVFFQQLGYISYISTNYSQAVNELNSAISHCSSGNCDSEHEFLSFFLCGKAHFELKNYNQSENYFKKGLNAWEAIENDRNDLLIPLLDQLNHVYFAQKDYSSLKESLEILQELFKIDETHIDEQRTFCNYRALISFIEGDIAQSRSFINLGIDLEKSKSDKAQATFYILRSVISYIQGNSFSGESDLDKALSILPNGEFDEPYSAILDLATAFFYQTNGDDKASILQLREAIKSDILTIRKQSYELLIELQIKHNLSQDARRTKHTLTQHQSELGITDAQIDRYDARILMIEGRVDEAILKYEQFKDLSEEDIDNYASLLVELGSYEEAKELYVNKLDEIAGSIGKGNNKYVTLLNNLGILYLQLEEYREAEYLLKDALNISQSTFGNSSEQYSNAANNLGTLYFEIGNYEESVNYFSIAKQLYLSLFSKESQAYLTLQNNIAILYSAIGDHETSIELLSSNLSLEHELFGEKNLSYLITLNNLAKERISNNEYDIALSNAKDVIDVLHNSKTGQKELARAYFLQGLAYFEKSAYVSAISSFDSSLSKYNEINETSTKEYAIVLFKLAESHAIKGNKSDSKEFFDRSISLLNSSIERVFSFSSEKEKEKYLKTIQRYYDLYNYYIVSHFDDKELIAAKLFEQSVFRKGILFKSTVELRNAVMNSGKEELVDKYYEWISVQKRISQGIGFNDEKETILLEEKANQLEKELNQQVNIRSEGTNLTLNTIKSILNSDQAIVDVIRYYHPEEESYYYGCLVIKQNAKTVFISLSKEDEIIHELGEVAGNNKRYIDKLYGTASEHNPQLYKLIWAPISENLAQVKSVFLSPTGILHKVAFDAIGENSHSLVADEWNLRYISDLGKITNEDQDIIIQNVGLFGGIQYTTEKAKIEYWSYLPGTKIEVENIEEILSDSYEVDKFTGLDANESNFKKLAEEYEILHIATHGFFFPDQQSLSNTLSSNTQVVEDVAFRSTRKKAGLSMFSENNNPLIRSGIALAKANDLSNPDRYFSKEDGVLTAFEVSQMNLSKNKLVVLSACETGVGEIKGNEGVYGLERAFKMQGIPYLIISLWQVPDDETKEFMLLFYKNLARDNISVIDAFNSTQKQMRAKYPPYFWAAFKLVE